MSELSQLSDAKRGLLEESLRGNLSHAPSGPPPITRSTDAGPAPLSLGQEQIWLHAQVTSAFPVYNEPVTIHRRGRLDVAVLERCLAEIVRRHEILRTSFAEVDGRPVQIVHPPMPVPLPCSMPL